jgi:hypothetical protein
MSGFSPKKIQPIVQKALVVLKKKKSSQPLFRVTKRQNQHWLFILGQTSLSRAGEYEPQRC